MSFPTIGSTQVFVSISAEKAARLAFEINHLLSLVKDAQDDNPEFFLQLPAESVERRWLTNQLHRIRVRENVYLCINPDRPTPGTSAYLNYSAPLQYVEQGRDE